jgi:alpha-1,3-rhamnosyl/mannosyltransferase
MWKVGIDIFAAPAGTGAAERRRGRAKMRVVVNQLAALGQKTGVGHYTAELLRCLRRQAGPDQVDGFPTGWVGRARAVCANLRPRLEPRGSASPGQPGPPPRLLARMRGAALHHLRRLGRALTARYFRLVCSRRRYDLYHEPNFIPLAADRPTVVTIHDLSVLLHPEWHPADRVAHFERHFLRSLGQCAHFLTVSEFGRQEVIHTLNIAPERVTRIYNGIRPALSPLPDEQVAPVLRELGLPPCYLLCLGTIEPRKNLLMLLHAYCSLPAELRERWPLVLAGGWGWNTMAIADYLHREARHRGVLHLGYLPERHVAAVYNGARALVFPSRYEGFGLPPVEMMACGGAVLASTAGALVETVGRRAHLIDPDDIDGWRAALARVVQDDDWWRSLRRGVVELARPYTWQRCAADTLQVYRSLTGAPTARPEPVRRAA